MLPATSWVVLMETQVNMHQLTSAQVLREEDEICNDFPNSYNWTIYRWELYLKL